MSKELEDAVRKVIDACPEVKTMLEKLLEPQLDAKITEQFLDFNYMVIDGALLMSRELAQRIGFTTIWNMDRGSGLKVCKTMAPTRCLGWVGQFMDETEIAKWLLRMHELQNDRRSKKL